MHCAHDCLGCHFKKGHFHYCHCFLLTSIDYDMSKLLDKKLDGMDFWNTLSTDQEHSPRTEFLYNIDRGIKCSALRVNDMKIIMGLNYGKEFNGWLPQLKVS